jgi:hypothetical protein
VIVKVCRDCGEEYRPEIERCADCGGELVAGDLAEDGHPRSRSGPDAEAEDDRPPGDYRPIAWAATAAELTRRADALVEAGLPFYLRPRESSPGERSGYEIRVRREEWPQALAAFESAVGVAAVASRGEHDEHHDGEDGGEADDPTVDGVTADAPPASGASDSSADEGRCPACSAHVTPGAAECPDCGLSFAAPPDGD